MTRTIKTPNTGIIVDVTTVISAQDYITSSNSNLEPADPFARQCFAELMQTLVLQPSVYVIHPQRLTPTTSDFGNEPHLLQVLFATGLASPLQVARSSESKRENDEQLESELRLKGARLLLEFIDRSAEIDSARAIQSLGERLLLWTEYQDARVRHEPDGHRARIPTVDGIEEDPIGEWVRATALAAEGELRRLAIPGFESALLAHLVRGIRYFGLIAENRPLYQTHPTRRDFSLYANIRSGSEETGSADNLLREIRGVHEAVKLSAGPRHTSRFEIAEIATPLLGGRLWADNETGRVGDKEWIERVGGRVSEYRSRAEPLRSAIAAAITEEGRLRLKRDLQNLTTDLIRDLGFRPAEPTLVENDLRQVASVADAATGLPLLTAASIVARSGLRRMVSSRAPHAQFLYKELKRGYTFGSR